MFLQFIRMFEDVLPENEIRSLKEDTTNEEKKKLLGDHLRGRKTKLKRDLSEFIKGNVIKEPSCKPNMKKIRVSKSALQSSSLTLVTKLNISNEKILNNFDNSLDRLFQSFDVLNDLELKNLIMAELRNVLAMSEEVQ